MLQKDSMAQRVTSPSLQKTEFNTRSVHMEFQVDTVAVVKVIFPSTLVFPYQPFPPMIHPHSFTYHQCHTIMTTGGVTK